MIEQLRLRGEKDGDTWLNSGMGFPRHKFDMVQVAFRSIVIFWLL